MFLASIDCPHSTGIKNKKHYRHPVRANATCTRAQEPLQDDVRNDVSRIRSEPMQHLHELQSRFKTTPETTFPGSHPEPFRTNATPTRPPEALQNDARNPEQFRTNAISTRALEPFQNDARSGTANFLDRTILRNPTRRAIPGSFSDIFLAHIIWLSLPGARIAAIEQCRSPNS